MVKEILVFKKNGAVNIDDSNTVKTFKLKVWKPGMFSYLPPQMPNKYFLYWLFHYGRVFQNSSYAAYLLYNNEEIVSSCLVVPSHFKWPFMGKKDVQFTFVMTNEKYKGQGIAGKLIEKVMADLASRVHAFWYVTDTKNYASIRVAEKIGFQSHGIAERKGFLKQLQLKSI